MQTTILIEPADLETVRSALTEVEGIREVMHEHRDSLDAKDVVALALEYADRDTVMLFFAFLAGTRTRFRIDQNGLVIIVRDFNILLKFWRALKSADDSNDSE